MAGLRDGRELESLFLRSGTPCKLYIQLDWLVVGHLITATCTHCVLVSERHFGRYQVLDYSLLWQVSHVGVR